MTERLEALVKNRVLTHNSILGKRTKGCDTMRLTKEKNVLWEKKKERYSRKEAILATHLKATLDTDPKKTGGLYTTENG